MLFLPFLFFGLLRHCRARPWEFQQRDISFTGAFIPQLVQEIDSLGASFLSQSQVTLFGAGAMLAYLGYASSFLLTDGDVKHKTAAHGPLKARFDNTSSDIFGEVLEDVVRDSLERSESATAFKRASARSLQHGAVVLRRGLNALSKVIGAVYSALVTSQRALRTDCVAEQLCRIGQITSVRWPILGVFVRSLTSIDLDEYAKALIDGTTVGDCRAVYPNCLQ